jgi:glycosyltransferase involved in cell wall biosynthesis
LPPGQYQRASSVRLRFNAGSDSMRSIISLWGAFGRQHSWGRSDCLSSSDRLAAGKRPRPRSATVARSVQRHNCHKSTCPRRSFTRFGHFHAHSRYSESVARPLWKKTLVFLPLGIQKEQLGSPRTPRQTPPRLLYAGRLLYRNGVHIAIQTFAELLTKIPNARFTIVGSGPEEARCPREIVTPESGLILKPMAAIQLRSHQVLQMNYTKSCDRPGRWRSSLRRNIEE